MNTEEMNRIHDETHQGGPEVLYAKSLHLVFRLENELNQ